jgi:hypothetical protein
LAGVAELATLTLDPTTKATADADKFVVNVFEPVPIRTEDVDVTPE